jgi:hypothetical protein
MTRGAGGGELFAVWFLMTVGAIVFGKSFEFCSAQGGTDGGRFVAFDAIDRLMLADEFEGGIGIMGKLQFGTCPASSGVACGAGDCELAGVLVAVAVGAEGVLQPHVVDAGHVSGTFLFVAFVAFDAGVLAIEFEVGEVVVKSFPVQRDDGFFIFDVFAVTVPTVAFQGAVVTGLFVTTFLDDGVAGVAFGIGYLAGVGMTFGAGFSGGADAVFGGQFAGFNGVGKRRGKIPFDRCEPTLLEREQSESGQQHGDGKHSQLKLGDEDFFKNGLGSGWGNVFSQRTG